LAINCSVSQSLADCAANRSISPILVIDAQGDPVTVTEVEFREVTVKVLLADVEVTAVNAALQDREEALNGVGVRLGAIPKLARPFLSSVIHGVVTGKALADASVSAKFISHQPTLGVRSSEHNAAQSCGGNVLDLLRSRAPAALDQGNDGYAIGSGTPYREPMQLLLPFIGEPDNEA
jgi:hypothetical protein